jgi:hypothetical protein
MSKKKFPKDEIIKALWLKGDLGHKLKSHQVLVYNKLWQVINEELGEEHTYVINCARRFGKSFVLILVAIEFCIRNPGAQVRYALPVQVTYRDIVLPSLNLICLDAPKELNIEHFKSEKRIDFGNGSSIKWAGCDNGNAVQLRGSSSSLNLVDEAGFVDDLQDIYESILAPLTITTNGKTIFSSTPPSTLDHDYCRLYREHAERGMVSQFTIYDNISLTPKQLAKAIKESGGEDSTTFKREYLCQFIQDAEISIIPNWSEAYIKEWPRSPQYFGFYHKYVCMDLGVRDLTVALFGYYDFENAKLIIEDEVVMNGPNMTTQLLAAEIHAKMDLLGYKNPKLNRLIADNALQIIQDLSIIYKLPFAGTSKNDLDAMINRVRIMVGDGKVIVNPKCKNLIGCMKFGVWQSRDHIGRMFGRSPTLGHYDAIAAITYLIFNLDTRSNPIPHLHGVDLSNSYVAPGTTQVVSDTARKLQQAFYPNRRATRR